MNDQLNQEQTQENEQVNAHQIITSEQFTTIKMQGSEQNWEDVIESVRHIERSTPLQFSFKLKGTFLVCYRKDKIISVYIKILMMILIGAAINIVILLSTIITMIKLANLLLTISAIILYSLLQFLDPGTLCQDQQECFDKDRLYCTICQFYRLPQTRHCPFCNRCIRKYDHHCTYFGKCIGTRNFCIFYTFLMNNLVVCLLNMVLLIYLAVENSMIKSQH